MPGTSASSHTTHVEGRGGVPSFETVPNEIRDNLISANYGSSQGVDNDDGSSFYHTHGNVFYAADGFKMDYGGHDSRFEENLIMVAPYDGQNCVNNLGARDVYANNTCVVTGSRQGTPDVVGGYPCDGGGRSLVVERNHYMTIHGNASVKCGQKALPLAQVQKLAGLEKGSVGSPLPSDATMVKWAREMVGKWLP